MACNGLASEMFPFYVVSDRVYVAKEVHHAALAVATSPALTR